MGRVTGVCKLLAVCVCVWVSGISMWYGAGRVGLDPVCVCV